MAKKDVALEKYFQDNARFADLLNAVMFQGKQVIKPGDVREQDSAVKGLVKRGRRRFLIQKYRDALRKIALGMSFVVVGIEHQDQTHFAMPVRVMLSDAAAYDRQVQKIGRMHRKKRDLKGAEFVSRFSDQDRLIPVFTIVLYYGEGEWQGARELYELMDYEALPEPVKQMLNNYRIYVLDVRRFKEIERFRTDLRELFTFLQNIKDKNSMEQIVQNDNFLSLDEDTYEAMAALGDIPDFETMKDKFRIEGGKINMCRAFEELMESKWLAGREDGIEVGKSEGRTEGAFLQAEKTAYNMFRRGFSVEDVSVICELDHKKVSELFEKWKGKNRK